MERLNQEEVKQSHADVNLMIDEEKKSVAYKIDKERFNKEETFSCVVLPVKEISAF